MSSIRFIPGWLHPYGSKLPRRPERRSALVLLVVLLVAVADAIPTGDADPQGSLTNEKAVEVSRPDSSPASLRQEPTPTTNPSILRQPPAGSSRRCLLGTTAARLRENENVRIAELSQRFQAAPDHATALALQREIETIKLETELSLLRLQAASARDQGRVGVAETIEARIEKIQRPEAARIQVERPVPAAAPAAAVRP